MNNLGTRSTDSLYRVCEDAIDSICKTWNTTHEDVLAKFHGNMDPGKDSDRWGMAFTDFATVFFYAVGVQLYPTSTHAKIAYSAWRLLLLEAGLVRLRRKRTSP